MTCRHSAHPKLDPRLEAGMNPERKRGISDRCSDRALVRTAEFHRIVVHRSALYEPFAPDEQENLLYVLAEESAVGANAWRTSVLLPSLAAPLWHS
jgi:hypothetical protein